MALYYLSVTMQQMSTHIAAENNTHLLFHSFCGSRTLLLPGSLYRVSHKTNEDVGPGGSLK